MTEIRLSIASGPAAAQMPIGTIDPRAILEMRREMKVIFGWKKDYGKLTDTADAKKKRADAEARAERFVANCCVAFGGNVQAFEKLMAEFNRVKRDFGWKEDYGKLTTTAKSGEKREEAERKAEEVVAKMGFN